MFIENPTIMTTLEYLQMNVQTTMYEFLKTTPSILSKKQYHVFN